MDETYAVDGAELGNVRGCFAAALACSRSASGARRAGRCGTAGAQITMVGKIVSVAFTDQLARLDVNDSTGTAKVEKYVGDDEQSEVRRGGAGALLRQHRRVSRARENLWATMSRARCAAAAQGPAQAAPPHERGPAEPVAASARLCRGGAGPGLAPCAALLACERPALLRREGQCAAPACACDAVMVDFDSLGLKMTARRGFMDALVHKHCHVAILRPASSRLGSKMFCMLASHAPAGAPDCAQSWCCIPGPGDSNAPSKPCAFGDVPAC